jgi:SAM-dependent methyltransferase
MRAEGSDARLRAIRDRYTRRDRTADSRLYDPLDPYVMMSRRERERTIIKFLHCTGMQPVADRRVLEIGCGTGANLLELIRLGFRPENLTGNDLLEDRLELARSRLPASVTLLSGDASSLELAHQRFDIVLKSTVFTSILDDALQVRVTTRMWELVRPGGGILWYDFTCNNPANPDVRGVPLWRIRNLFPHGPMRRWRVTLAPPIGRRLCRISPALYPLANAVPLLRTHALCWVHKT